MSLYLTVYACVHACPAVSLLDYIVLTLVCFVASREYCYRHFSLCHALPIFIDSGRRLSFVATSRSLVRPLVITYNSDQFVYLFSSTARTPLIS